MKSFLFGFFGATTAILYASFMVYNHMQFNKLQEWIRTVEKTRKQIEQIETGRCADCWE